MDDLSSMDYAITIAESKTNGQHQQAIKQFNRAISDDVNTQSLVSDIAEAGLSDKAIINLLCGVIGN